MILQLVKLQEKELFFPALYLRPILREARSLPLPLVLFSILLESAVTHVAFVSCFSTHFMIFSWRLGGGGHATHFSIFYLEYDIEKGGMGRLPSCVNPLLIFPVQSFLLLSCLSCFKHPSLMSRDFPSTFFCSIYFFLFLVFTLYGLSK